MNVPLCALVALGLTITSCYDDNMLRTQIEELDDRLVYLETLCQDLNTNVSSMKSLIEAIDLGDYITDVEPISWFSYCFNAPGGEIFVSRIIVSYYI